jgi:hypothetical protein
MEAPVGHDGRSMQDQPPDTKPGIIPSVGTLARTHGSRALRIAAWCAAGVAALAIVGGAIHLAKRSPAPPPVSPTGSKGLTVSWTASLGDGPITGVAASADTLYVSGIDGLSGYPLPCVPRGGTCHATWQNPIPDGPLSRAALLNDGIYVGATHGHVYAFPTQCSILHCRPVWNGVAGDGPVPTPSVNEDFVYAATRRLYAFPTHCGTDDRNCAAAWIGDLPGRAAGSPQGGGGLVVVSSMGRAGGIVAFPAVCTDPCHPTWTGATGGPAGPTALSADSAFVVAHGRLLAFPMSCAGTCTPTWTGPLPGSASSGHTLSTPLVDGDSVYIAGADGRLYVFATSCAETSCAPVATYPLGSSPLLTPIVEQGVVYLVSRSGSITAIPAACDPAVSPAPSGGCGSPTTRNLTTGSDVSPDAADGALYVGDDKGTVHAYTLLAPPS